MRQFPFKKKVGSPRIRPVVQVETSSMCNVRCIWCLIHYPSVKEDSGLMSLENFKKFVDLNVEYFLKTRSNINPYYRGEPLINPSFFDMIDYADKAGIRFDGIHTNLSMKLDTARLMESPIPYIIVNIGGITEEVHRRAMRGSDLTLVKHNLRKMLETNINKSVWLKMNVTKHNYHQVHKLPSFFEALGGNPKEIWVGEIAFILPSEFSNERERFFKEVVSEEVKPFLRFRYDTKNNIITKRRNCWFIRPTITWDGKVTICCHDQLNRLNFGNAFKTPLIKIVKDKQYKAAREKGIRMELDFCKECN